MFSFNWDFFVRLYLLYCRASFSLTSYFNVNLAQYVLAWFWNINILVDLSAYIKFCSLSPSSDPEREPLKKTIGWNHLNLKIKIKSIWKRQLSKRRFNQGKLSFTKNLFLWFLYIYISLKLYIWQASEIILNKLCAFVLNIF